MDITITPEEMKALETDYMQQTGVPGALLMEHAAQGVAAALGRHAAPSGRVLFLCGPGNNGGDGYASARLWQARGGQSVIAEMSSAPRGDAGMNRELARQMGISLHPLRDAAAQLNGCDAVCDALFGTGLDRAIEGEAAAIIAQVNAAGKPVIAVDIPSGLHGKTGHPTGPVIRATETVTFHRMKQGLLLGESADWAGQIAVQPILMPAAWGDVPGLRCMTPADLPALLPPRRPGAHKGTYGKAVLLVGSYGMAGAAALCARACVKAGAGLVYVLCPAAVLPVVQVLVPGAVCAALPERDGEIAPEAAEMASAWLHGATCGAIGCGLGQSKALLPILAAFRAAACPVIWDADALNLLAASTDLLPLPAHHVITPHPGEAARLLRASVPAVEGDRLAALRHLHARCGCGVLLKGARTLMTDGKVTAVNRFGSPAMAKGGSGDILTGLLCGLCCQRQDADMLENMQMATLLHGLAGIRAAARYGERGVLPEQLIEELQVKE